MSKTEYQKLRFETENLWRKLPSNEITKLMEFGDHYRNFLDRAKTERLAVREIVAAASDAGYKSVGTETSAPGYYHNFKNVAVTLWKPGQNPVERGLSIVAAHIDSPRIDLKSRPVYEDSELALLKTHYYGGIKKYQWVTRPLALYGVVVKTSGEIAEIALGDAPEDPVFTIADLLPHLWRKAQADKKATEVITGEKLNIITGSIPVDNDRETKDSLALNVLKLLHDRYAIEEADLISADLELVPAGAARDVGLDRGIVGAYGQDDRVCAWAGLHALLQAKAQNKHLMMVFFDKEEIGSVGDGGANSRVMETFVRHYLRTIRSNADPLDVLAASECISADVNAAINPDWKDVHDTYNAARLSHGPVLTKYTGSGGKAGSNDAHAEYLGRLRSIFEKHNITYQTGELGRVDEGGGGTIAGYLAAYGMDMVDMGVGVISMHSPFELTSKADIWMMYKAYRAFFEQ